MSDAVAERGHTTGFSHLRLVKYPPHNLPLQLTSLVAREGDVAEIRRLLTTSNEGVPPIRLLTLTGAGGSGKTRLALAAAQDLLDQFEDGAFLVNLAPIRDPQLVLPTIAQTLGVREQGVRPLAESLVDHLRDKQMLLTLDNFEQVAEAAVAIVELVAQCPRLTAIVTSRAPLHVRGEQEYPVAPLATPPIGSPNTLTVAEVAAYPAVQLFVQRAQAARPTFALNEANATAVAEICRRLDGLPLAIELAAVRVKTLTPQVMLSWLDRRLQLLTTGPRDAPERQRTLRSAIEWSYELLDEAEKRLLRRLVVFVGGATLEAIEAVTNLDGDLDVLEVVTALIDQNLLQQVEGVADEPRYAMLQTIHEYGREQLSQGEQEDILRRRHLDFYLALAEEAEPKIRGSEQAVWLARLEAEHDNLRAALDYARETVPAEIGLRLAGALGRFWQIRGHLVEGRQWIETMLARSGESAAAVRAKALGYMGLIAYLERDYAQASAYFDASLALWRAVGDRERIANILNSMGRLANDQGDYETGRRLQTESLALFRELGDKGGVALLLNNMAGIAYQQGDYATARAMYEESLAQAREMGEKRVASLALNNLGMLAEVRGDYEASRHLYEESLALKRELGEKAGIATSLHNLGVIASDEGDYVRARALFEEGLAMQRELGDKRPIAYSLNHLGRLAYREGNLSAARALYEQTLPLFRGFGDRWGVATTLTDLANVVRDQGDTPLAREFYEESLNLRRELGDRKGVWLTLTGLALTRLAEGELGPGVRLLAAAEKARDAIGAHIPPADRPGYEQRVSALRAALGEKVFEEVWSEGATMSMEQVTALALERPVVAIQATTHHPFPVTNRQSHVPLLRLFALGPARVYRGEQMLTSADWTYARARELVFYLLCHPGVTREQIGLEFWPDASPEQVRSRLSAVLTHARAALGRETEWIVFEEGGYRLNRSPGVWYDVEAFEAGLEGAKNEAIDEGALAATLDLYRGDFLADINSDWTTPLRETLRQMYLDGLLRLGQARFEAGQFVEAGEVYRRVVAKDNSIEAAHRELMRCYARLGERGLALKQYDALVQGLDELGAPPSVETRRLVDRLKRGEEV